MKPDRDALAKALADRWDGGEDEAVAHVLACAVPACRKCVAVACAADLRALLAGVELWGEDAAVDHGWSHPTLETSNALRVMYGLTPREHGPAPSPCGHGRRYCTECHGEDFL